MLKADRKNHLKRIGTKIVSVLLVTGILLSSATTTVYAVEKFLEKKNTSDSIYRWTRVYNTVELMELTVNNEEFRGKDLRILLIPAVSEGKSNKPVFETYSIIDDDEDCLVDISLSDNKMISHESDVFYTRGAFRAPYLVYMGMADSKDDIESCGEAVPTYRMYEADKNDKKTSELLIGRETTFLNPSQYVWTEKDLGDLSSNKSDDTWSFAFLTSHDKKETTVGKSELGKTTYWNYLDGLMSLGCVINGAYHWITDDYYGVTMDYYLVDETKIESWYQVNEIFYKCYIGVKEDNVNAIDGTLTVNDGQIKTLSGVSLIEQDAVLEVKEGGTLFISGNCYNNGIIKSSGGTIVLQKGALVTTLDSTSSSSGRIIISGGDLIIREGVRIVNQNKISTDDKKGGVSILVEEDGYVLNKGIISVLENINLEGKAEMDNEGSIYTGYVCKDSSVGLLGYNADDTDMNANEFAEYATKLFVKNVKKKQDRSINLIQVDGNTGVFRNEGKNY